MSYLRLDDYTVQGHGIQVTLAMKFKDADASGDSSSTAKAEQGTKGKKLDVKLYIRFAEGESLGGLIAVAEAKENGKGKIYTITNPTANTAGMRQVFFTGDFKARQAGNLLQWEVSFSLAEHLSVPERAESRLAAKEIAVQEHDGDIKAPPPEPEEKLSTWERLLKDADKILEQVGGGNAS